MTDFKLQKCLYLADELKKKTPKLQGNYMITPKIDGWWVRILYKKETGLWYTPLSSANRIIPALTWMVDKLNTLPKPHDDCFLIGEAIIPELPFETINGMLNRSVGNFACLDAEIVLHDIVFPGYSNSAMTRWRFLQELDISNVPFLSKVVVLYIGSYNLPIWMKYFDQFVSQGGEGIVAKRETGLYLPTKRNADLIKLKLECSIDALAVRLEESIGEKGLPALTLVSRRASGVEIRTVIGKHVDQVTFRADYQSILGKVVEIKGMNELPDGQIRQPVFKGIRFNKNPSEID